MYTKNELENLINKHAKTNVSMHGEIDANGQYSGYIEGCSTDELYAFVCYIAETRGKAFDRVDFRHGQQNPPTFICHIKFDTNELLPKKGFFSNLFG